MSRTRFVIALLAVAAVIAVAVVLATGSLSGTGHKAGTPNAASPSCLPTTLSHSAKLAGLPVDVTPAPETDTANPHTQISFLGVAPAQIQDVSVVGEHSGHHSGQLHAYSQGDGASFVPDTPFDVDERVTVSATIGAGRSRAAGTSQSVASANGKRVSFDFRVDTPYSTANAQPFPNPQAAPADYQSFDTLPGVQAPVLSVTVPDRDPAAGDILTTNGPGPGQYGPLIYTPQGRLVWFDHLPGGETAEDLNVQSYEGRRDLTFWHGKVLSLGFGQGEDVVMNSHYRTVARVPGGNGLQADLHDFQIASHDISYIDGLQRDPLQPLIGRRSQQRGDPGHRRAGDRHEDRARALGMAQPRPRGRLGVARPQRRRARRLGTGFTSTRSTWRADANRSGNIFISARSTWAGYQLEGGSGNILWRLGGLKSSFKMGPGTETAWQHDGRILPNGEVTFFDDGSNPPIHQQSRGLRIGLDFATHEAHLLSAYTHPDPPLLSASQGNMQTLADGNAVVGYGGLPAIGEFAPGGELLFDAHLPFDMSFYRAFRFPWSGHPSTPPTVLANLNNTGEETIVHISWNGASEVASWRVLAGERPGSLTPRTTIPASDFESSTILPKKYAYAAVQALDAAGNVLGSSKPAKVSKYAAALPSTPQSG